MQRRTFVLALVLAVILTACNQQPTTTPFTPQIVATAPGVAFQPLVGNVEVLTGNFDDTVNLSIEVFDLVNGEAVGVPIGPSFSTTNGTIKVENEPNDEEYYQAKYDILASNRPEGATVRVEVRLGNAPPDAPACNPATTNVDAGCLAFIDLELHPDDEKVVVLRQLTTTTQAESNEDHEDKDDGEDDDKEEHEDHEDDEDDDPNVIELEDDTTLEIRLHIEYGAANVAPTVSITNPANNTTINQGDNLTLTGTAVDLEDGDLSANLSWTSSIDGTLGTGASVGTTSLSIGTHTITASVTDSGGRAGQDTVIITVESQPKIVPTGPLGTARIDHSATLLPDGKVLIAGGRPQSTSQVFDTAEIYDPTTGTFTPTGPLNVARNNHSAILLNNGKVLIVGGWNPWPSITDTAEIYDPATGTFTLLTSRMVTPRTNQPTLIKLPNGKVLIIAGVSSGSNGASTNKVELFDPSNNSFVQVGTLLAARRTPASAVLGDGRILIAGGGASNSNKADQDTAEIYDPSTNTSSATAGNMNFERDGNWFGVPTSAVLSNGQVLITLDGDFQDTPAEFFDPSTGLFSIVDNAFTFEAAEQEKLSNGDVLVSGLNGVRLFNNATLTFSNVDLTITKFGHSLTLLKDGTVLIAGGGNQGNGGPTNEAFLFSP